MLDQVLGLVSLGGPNHEGSTAVRQNDAAIQGTSHFDEHIDRQVERGLQLSHGTQHLHCLINRKQLKGGAVQLLV
ncbi:MAG: hypothetical protein COZ56_19450 [Armatimonadetes bacterium CG_4_8_14_3_um_filter_58_9]|nr:MAG: hypothetical protein COZ56_19450 [Armatimonadetes bacterium CG_4_8_14_3_um_filter_58_9]